MPERPRAQRIENEKDISKPYVKPRPHTSWQFRRWQLCLHITGVISVWRRFEIRIRALHDRSQATTFPRKILQKPIRIPKLLQQHGHISQTSVPQRAASSCRYLLRSNRMLLHQKSQKTHDHHLPPPLWPNLHKTDKSPPNLDPKDPLHGTNRWWVSTPDSEHIWERRIK